jgi:hypothetical protein
MIIYIKKMKKTEPTSPPPQKLKQGLLSSTLKLLFTSDLGSNLNKLLCEIAETAFIIQAEKTNVINIVIAKAQETPPENNIINKTRKYDWVPISDCVFTNT